MGLFFEVLIVCVAIWWLGRAAWRRYRERDGGSSADPGSHDAGVRVNEVAWARIVAQLSGRQERGDQGDGRSRRGPHE
jgi:hypothetical protein